MNLNYITFNQDYSSIAVGTFYLCFRRMLCRTSCLVDTAMAKGSGNDEVTLCLLRSVIMSHDFLARETFGEWL